VFWGLGGKEPIGFGLSGAMISVAKESGQAADTLVTENLLKAESRMLSRPGSQFAWYHHQSTVQQIGQLDIGNMPVSININNGGISQAPAQMLRGMPLVKSEFCKQLGDAGDIFLADLKMYKGITQSLVREDVSMHVEFLTDKSCLRFIVEFDGAPLYNTPVTPYTAGSAVDTVSSFIQIQERAA
jgi:HK97 family phage major capsid protein